MGKNRDKEIYESGGKPGKTSEAQQIENAFDRRLESGNLPDDMEEVLARVEKEAKASKPRGLKD